LAEEIGLAADLFRATFKDPETERVLAAAAEEAFCRGAFGVPTFFVGARMFWGNDRLTILKHVLKKQPSR
jgi:2-hydroxychromene-2-carboxylate isomerase